MDLETLRAKIGELQQQMQAIVNKADAENNGEMTDEQTKEFDDKMLDFEKTKADLDRREKLDRVTEDASSGNGRRTVAPQIPTERETQLKTTFGFESLGEFASAVAMATRKTGSVIDERLARIPEFLGAPSNFHRETGSDDGYMVPPEMRDRIWELVTQEDSLISRIDLEPTSSNSVMLNADETTPWDTTNGIQAYWAGEGAQGTPSRLSTEGRQVTLHKLFTMVTATSELIEDAPRLNNRLMVKAPQKIRWKLDEAIVYGSGGGQPLGYFNSGALVTVDPESGQLADTIEATNIANMYSRMMPSSIRNAVWLANLDIFPQLSTMTLGDHPIYLPGANIAGAPFGTLMGRPILYHELAKTLGDKGDLQFVDLRGYYGIQKQGGIRFAESMHLYFDYDVEAFRWTFRMGGQPYLKAPVSPNNGSATKSHFVTLGERA